MDSLAISTGMLGFAGWTLATTSECSNWVDMQLADEPESPIALNCDDGFVEGRECCGWILKICCSVRGKSSVGGAFILLSLPEHSGSPLSCSWFDFFHVILWKSGTFSSLQRLMVLRPPIMLNMVAAFS